MLSVITSTATIAVSCHFTRSIANRHCCLCAFVLGCGWLWLVVLGCVSRACVDKSTQVSGLCGQEHPRREKAKPSLLLFYVVVLCCCFMLLFYVVVLCCCFMLLFYVVVLCCCFMLLFYVVVLCCCFMLIEAAAPPTKESQSREI